MAHWCDSPVWLTDVSLDDLILSGTVFYSSSTVTLTTVRGLGIGDPLCFSLRSQLDGIGEMPVTGLLCVELNFPKELSFLLLSDTLHLTYKVQGYAGIWSVF